MAWANEEIAGLLREYAELTQITGGDVFRARNYEKAARSVRGWADDISLLDVKALRAIPGVGASIAAKIAEYRDTGSIGALDELRAKIPPGVLELTRVPGLGPISASCSGPARAPARHCRKLTTGEKRRRTRSI
jgi:DNA polymerase (family X)